MWKKQKENSSSIFIYTVLVWIISIIWMIIFFVWAGREEQNTVSSEEKNQVIPFWDEVQKLMEQQLKNPMNIMDITCEELTTDEWRKYCSNKQTDIKKLLK